MQGTGERKRPVDAHADPGAKRSCGGSSLAEQHVCSMFESDEDFCRSAIEFALVGIQAHAKVLVMTLDTGTELTLRAKNPHYFKRNISTAQKEVICAGLSHSEIAVNALRTGQLCLLEMTQAHLAGGRFAADQMLAQFEAGYEQALKEGYDGLRGTADMSWAGLAIPGASRAEIRDFEWKANDLFRRLPRLMGMCSYSSALVDPAVLNDMLLTHPQISFNGKLYRDNFYYVPPSEEQETEAERARLRYRLSNLSQLESVSRSLEERTALYRDAKAQLNANPEQAANLIARKQTIDNMATIAHEIRTPLSSISLAANLLAASPTPEHVECAELIENSSNYLQEVLSSILEYCRSEHGVVRLLQRHSFSLRQLIARVIRITSWRSSTKVQSHISEDVPDLFYGDSIKLSQIFVNLINNAIKFSAAAAEPTVVISVSPHKSSSLSLLTHGTRIGLLFSIRDNGVGIPLEQQSRVFEPFFQAASISASASPAGVLSEPRSYLGTGLGLSISKKFVDLMDGRISCKSDVGEGCDIRFTLALDIVPEHEHALHYARLSRPSPALQLNAPRSALRILIAEDNVTNQKVLLQLLSKLGHSAVAVSSGEAAVQTATESFFDVILMDIYMPGAYDGIEAARRIALHYATASASHKRAPKIITLSGSCSAEDAARCAAVGAYAQLAKPLSLSSLTELLRLIRTDAT